MEPDATDDEASEVAARRCVGAEGSLRDSTASCELVFRSMWEPRDDASAQETREQR